MAVANPAAARPGLGARMKRLEAVEGLLFAAPVVIGTLIFDVIPMIPSLYWSLTVWDGVTTPKFEGLRNFIRMWDYGDFANSIKVTLIFTLLNVPFTMLCGFLLALLVNRKLRGMTLFRAFYYLPVISSIVAVAMVWNFIFAPRFGLLNQALGLVGINGPNWKGEAVAAMVMLVIVSVWQSMGYNMVLYLAGLQGVPASLYEAAEIDGASSWQRVRHITIPLLTPTTFFILIMGFIGSFQVFALVWVMTAGGPGTTTEVYVFFLYEEAFRRFQYGMGSAIAMVGFTIIGLVTLFQWKVAQRWVFYG